MKKIKIATFNTGRPENIRNGYIGFKTFEEAESFAEKNNGRTVLLYREDGWNFYQYRKRTDCELDVTPESVENENEDHMMYYSRDQFEESFIGILADWAHDRCSFKTIDEFVGNFKKTVKKFDTLKEDEGIVTDTDFKFVRTIKLYTMELNEGEGTWYVGVEIPPSPKEFQITEPVKLAMKQIDKNMSSYHKELTKKICDLVRENGGLVEFPEGVNVRLDIKEGSVVYGRVIAVSLSLDNDSEDVYFNYKIYEKEYHSNVLLDCSIDIEELSLGRIQNVISALCTE